MPRNFDAGNYLIGHLVNSAQVINRMLDSDEIRQTILNIADLLVRTFKSGNKLLICGNGGSCADAQHIAAEFVGRYAFYRPALPAIALASPAALTAIGNDMGYVETFARYSEALLDDDDVLLAISTSGRSVNIFNALNPTGRTVLFTGAECEYCSSADYVLRIPSTSTPIIQQGYMAAAHAICGIVEEEMFG